MADLTQQRVRELLEYDQASGRLIRKVALGRREKAGEVAGTLQKSTGYRRVCVDGVVYREHRVIWLYVHGEWPSGEVDHINGVRDDNRIENLRNVARQHNNQNRRIAQRNNLSSGLLGVTKKRSKWVASIRVNGRLKHIGTFGAPQDAHAAYLSAKRDLHASCTI